MFPVSTLQRIRLPGFPRVRGDVPAHINTAYLPSQFSPRARGCSLFELSLLISGIVFPACAGMFPAHQNIYPPSACFPRVRGDVPPTWLRCRATGKFSPRARGCSPVPHHTVACYHVFPACAGMFRREGHHGRYRYGFPRVRGDVPALNQHTAMMQAFSPRARGCSGR